VIKRRGEPAVTDATAVARVRLRPRVACQSANEWRSLKSHVNPGVVEVELAPGASEFVELTRAD
jgi:hypothetical protein